MFSTTSLQLNKLCSHFKHISCPSFNCWNFIAYIGCISPFHSYVNTIYCLLTTCFKSINTCFMNIIFSIASKTNLKMRSHIFFSWFTILWVTRFILFVCCEKNMKIGQGLSMLLNPLFKVPLNELQ